MAGESNYPAGWDPSTAVATRVARITEGAGATTTSPVAPGPIDSYTVAVTTGTVTVTLESTDEVTMVGPRSLTWKANDALPSVTGLAASVWEILWEDLI
jgi:hypothetical protein